MTWEPPRANRDLKQLDAKNRAVRTLLGGFVLDVAIAVALVVAASFGAAEGWGDLEWAIMGFSIAKSVIHSLLSYLGRMKLSLLPPPNPQPEPNEDFPSPGVVPPAP